MKKFKKPILPRHARTLSDVAGYVHADGTIQPSIPDLVCYFNEGSYSRRFNILFLDSNHMMSLSEHGFIGLRTNFVKPSVKHGQRIAYYDLPENIQRVIRREVTPLDMLVESA